MAKKQTTNDVHKRLNDAISQYELNQSLIEVYMKKIESKQFDATDVREYKDLQKLNITLRKQINDMELLLNSGQLKTVKDENPFE